MTKESERTMKHKHAELIKAWADGAEIETLSKLQKCWVGVSHPAWEEDYEYRIMPEPKPEPKPDVVWYAKAYLDEGAYLIQGDHYIKVVHMGSKCREKCENSNVKFIFNGETGKLKSAEVL
jgi:hypothetical protein